MGRARKRHNNHRMNEVLAALQAEWRETKTKPIKLRIEWLSKDQSILALGSNTVTHLLKSLKGHCKDLRNRLCPAYRFIERTDLESGSANYDNVIEDGSPAPRDRVACICPNCRGKVEWPRIYIGSRGFSYECELEAMPIEVSCHLPSSHSGRIMRLIRIYKLKPPRRMLKLGWKRGSKRTNNL